jgi:hypothetical protein
VNLPDRGVVEESAVAVVDGAVRDAAPTTPRAKPATTRRRAHPRVRGADSVGEDIAIHFVGNRCGQR